MDHLDINILTVLAIAAVIADILFQIAKVTRRRSSLDVSRIGVTIRTLAAIILIIKFMSDHDPVLSIGQAIMTIVLLVYLAQVFRYHKGRSSKRAR